jgi:hypothetical protein
MWSPKEALGGNDVAECLLAHLRVLSFQRQVGVTNRRLRLSVTTSAIADSTILICMLSQRHGAEDPFAETKYIMGV